MLALVLKLFSSTKNYKIRREPTTNDTNKSKITEHIDPSKNPPQKSTERRRPKRAAPGIPTKIENTDSPQPNEAEVIRKEINDVSEIVTNDQDCKDIKSFEDFTQVNNDSINNFKSQDTSSITTEEEEINFEEIIPEKTLENTNQPNMDMDNEETQQDTNFAIGINSAFIEDGNKYSELDINILTNTTNTGGKQQSPDADTETLIKEAEIDLVNVVTTLDKTPNDNVILNRVSGGHSFCPIDMDHPGGVNVMDSSSTPHSKNKSDIESPVTSSIILDQKEDNCESLHEAYKVLEAVKLEVSKAEDEIKIFKGGVDDVDYITLDEIMIKSMIKLDNIDVRDNSKLRHERRELIKYIQRCIKLLEERASAQTQS